MRLFHILTLMTLLTSCESELKFDSTMWKDRLDMDFYPYRGLMLRDIVDSKRFVGQKLQSVIDSLGQPENYVDKNPNELWYLVTAEYGGIDPVYTKHLVLTLNKDSTIERLEIKEWKQSDQ